jgi:hypothetical protein
MHYKLDVLREILSSYSRGSVHSRLGNVLR